MDRDNIGSLLTVGGILVLFAVFLFGVFVGRGTGRDDGVRDTRIEAAKVGAGEWVVDESGKTDFKWKGNKK